MKLKRNFRIRIFKNFILLNFSGSINIPIISGYGLIPNVPMLQGSGLGAGSFSPNISSGIIGGIPIPSVNTDLYVSRLYITTTSI